MGREEWRKRENNGFFIIPFDRKVKNRINQAEKGGRSRKDPHEGRLSVIVPGIPPMNCNSVRMNRNSV